MHENLQKIEEENKGVPKDINDIRAVIKGTMAWNIFIPEYAPNQWVY